MGLGIGIDCKRCGLQLCHPYFDREKELCGKCLIDLKKKEYDEEHYE